jgi:hypothetical protein
VASLLTSALAIYREACRHKWHIKNVLVSISDGIYSCLCHEQPALYENVIAEKILKSILSAGYVSAGHVLSIRPPPPPLFPAAVYAILCTSLIILLAFQMNLRKSF